LDALKSNLEKYRPPQNKDFSNVDNHELLPPPDFCPSLLNSCPTLLTTRTRK
jgi:hypothetical protein